MAKIYTKNNELMKANPQILFLMISLIIYGLSVMLSAAKKAFFQFAK
jgi:hypothetical protein